MTAPVKPSGRAAISASRSPSGVWAKSTMTSNGWPARTGSKRPGTTGAARSPAAIDVRGEPQLGARRRRSQAVRGVEPPADRHLDLLAAPDVGVARRADAQVGDVVERVGHHRDRDAGGQAATVLVVDVDHRPGAQRRVEQQRLGGEVLLHRPVQVEVVAPEVGEHGDVEPAAGDTTERRARATTPPSPRPTSRRARTRRGGPAAPATPAWCAARSACRSCRRGSRRGRAPRRRGSSWSSCRSCR